MALPEIIPAYILNSEYYPLFLVQDSEPLHHFKLNLFKIEMLTEGGFNMEDLNLTMRLLTTSSDLEQASVSLKKMASGQAINEEDKKALSWTGMFLSAMDFREQVDHEPQVGGGLTVQATSIRPTFYSCLFRIAPKLKEAGITSEKEVITFLSRLYRNLTSLGAPGKGFKKLTKKESEIGVLLLEELAESILVEINNNGLPAKWRLLNQHT
jgi:hypothetical protein